MFNTPAIRSRTPAKTHQPLIRLSSFMSNPFVIEQEHLVIQAGTSLFSRCFLRWLPWRDCHRSGLYVNRLVPMRSTADSMVRHFEQIARLMVGVAATCAVFTPAGASASPLVVHQLGARASSTRVLNSSADGTRTNGKILGLDPLTGPYSGASVP